MFRALLELFVTIVAIIVARAILTSILRGIANAGRVNSSAPRQPNGSPQNQASPNQGRSSQPPQASGELHKDPVCGTYVAESTPYRRHASGQDFYYCSDDCREKHALVAR